MMKLKIYSIITVSFVFLAASFFFIRPTFATPFRALPSIPTLPPFPTTLPIPTFPIPPKIDITHNKSAVVITDPQDQAFEDISKPLDVKVHYNASNIDINVGSDPTKTAYLAPIKAVELLLNGKSIEVKQLNPPQKIGDLDFNVSFDSLPKDATQAALQARIYNFYIPPIPFIPINFNKPAASSDTVTVVFKQLIGPEGGVVTGDDDYQVLVPPGAFSKPTEVAVDPTEAGYTLPPIENDLTYLGEANLFFNGNNPTKPVDISIPAPTDIQVDDQILVTQLIDVDGQQKLKLVDLADVQNGNLVSQSISFPFSFPQINLGGLFSFFTPWATKNPQNAVGFVKGQVLDQNGKPIQGAIISISSMPSFSDKTDTNGTYLVPTVIGSFSITAFDPATGNAHTVASSVPTKGGGIILNITIFNDNLTTNSALKNGGFDDTFNNWQLTGQGYVDTSLGSLTPPVGSHMALITNGALSVDKIWTSLKQKFVIPQGTKKLAFTYDFITREYPHFVGSQFNDQFEADLSTPKGILPIASMSVNNPDAKFQPINVSFPSEDPNDGNMGQTNWRNAEIDVSAFNGQVVTLSFTVSDVGDAIFDTGILLANVHLESGGGDTPFLQFPVDGYTPQSAPVGSVLDHSSQFPYTRDGKVETFGETTNGVKGTFYVCFPYLAQYDGVKTSNDSKLCPKGNQIPLFGYLRSSSGAINGIKYNGGNELDYDGHPGYDYDVGTENPGKAVHPAASGILNIINDGVCTVEVDHPNGFVTRYLHMDLSGITKKTGDSVSTSDVIGHVSGCGGNHNLHAFLPHLHFEVYRTPFVNKKPVANSLLDPYGWSGDVQGEYGTSGYLWK